ncbi:MAG: glutaredoxin family protein [Polaromonas sp.]|nr:glutaredoxin family protein [Polaromonas sp.]
MTLGNVTSKLFRFVQTSAALAVTALCLLPLAATAQVYRIVGADGKITFSDKPPADSSAKATAPGSGTANAVAGNSLPFELRQVATKYPVTLYVGNDCGPCGAARSMLTSRGVPFTEKTVNSNDDIQALQRLSSDNSLPFLTIGGQQLKGFADSEWTQYLNAAGYPASSVLPASYRAPAATPLVAAKTVVPTAAAADAPARTRPAPATVAPPARNPAGIVF